MVNAQQWLDNDYPIEERNEIEEIFQPEGEILEGDLIIENFPILKEINLQENRLNLVRINNCLECETVNLLDNHIITLEIINCPKIESLDCNNNRISQLPIELNLETLTSLTMTKNNFQINSDLSMFSRFVNLTSLEIGKNIAFSDSLEKLINLKKLKEIDIVETNIRSGLEYLPGCLEYLYCNDDQFPELESYKKSDEDEDDYYDYQSWKRDVLTRRKNELEVVLTNFKLTLSKKLFTSKKTGIEGIGERRKEIETSSKWACTKNIIDEKKAEVFEQVISHTCDEMIKLEKEVTEFQSQIEVSLQNS